MLRLGYPAFNITLRPQHILTGRTCRMSPKCREELIPLFLKNLADLERIVEWNIENRIFLYRLDSSLAPHITNPGMNPGKDGLIYNPSEIPEAVTILQRIGKLARNSGMRLTFHPTPFDVLSNEDQWAATSADLRWHAIILDILNTDDAVLVMHGGGTYGDKKAAMKTWIRGYLQLPGFVREYVVLENDESRYSIRDVLDISLVLKARGYQLPIVLDIFHHYIYASLHRVKIPLASVLPGVVRSWGTRRVKMHISEQKPGGKIGAHSDYVEKIPTWMLHFPKVYGDLDLMIEAKGHELAVFKLREKYNLQ